jgi:hypothetical protein
MKFKRKTSSANPLVRLWREFLFTREFEFEIDAPLGLCAKVLEEIQARAPEESAIAKATIIQADLYRRPLTGGYDVVIAVKSIAKYPTLIWLVADGELFFDTISQRVVLRGEVQTKKRAIGFFLLLIATILAWGVFKLPSTTALILIGTQIIFLGYMLALRTYLIETIEATANYANHLAREAKQKPEAVEDTHDQQTQTQSRTR